MAAFFLRNIMYNLSRVCDHDIVSIYAQKVFKKIAWVSFHSSQVHLLPHTGFALTSFCFKSAFPFTLCRWVVYPQNWSCTPKLKGFSIFCGYKNKEKVLYFHSCIPGLVSHNGFLHAAKYRQEMHATETLFYL